MLKIVFPNGHTRVYKEACFKSGDNLYTDETKSRWVASITESGNVIEAINPTRVEGIDLPPNELAASLLRYEAIRDCDIHYLRQLKKMLIRFDAKKGEWRW